MSYDIESQRSGPYRSKLEHAFADILTAWKLRFEYEPGPFQIDAFREYTPDFVLPSAFDRPVFIEVKPTAAMAANDSRLKRLVKIEDAYGLVVFRTELGSTHRYDKWQSKQAYCGCPPDRPCAWGMSEWKSKFHTLRNFIEMHRSL